MDKINVTFQNMKSSDALRDYAIEKLTKRENLLDRLVNGDIVVIQEKGTRGVDKDFRIHANFSMPQAVIRVEETNADMYAAIDAASDVLFRRLKRYHDKRKFWEGSTPWRVIEAEVANQTLDEVVDVEDINYADYQPKLSEIVKVKMKPMDPAEAIERMELAGRMQILFKNSENGQYAMIFKRINGDYVMEVVDEEV